MVRALPIQIEGEIAMSTNRNDQEFFSAVSAVEDIPPKHTSSEAFRVVHGDKELVEKLGRNDLCPCGSGRRFQEMLYEEWPVRR